MNLIGGQMQSAVVLEARTFWVMGCQLLECI